METTTIKITKRNHERLGKLGSANMTMDDVVNMLLNYYDERKTLRKLNNQR